MWLQWLSTIRVVVTAASLLDCLHKSDLVKLVSKCHTNMARPLVSTTKRGLGLLCSELNVAAVGQAPPLEDYILQKVKVKSSRPHTCTGVRQSLASCNCTNLQPARHTPKQSDLSFKRPLTFGYSHTGFCAIRISAARPACCVCERWGWDHLAAAQGSGGAGAI